MSSRDAKSEGKCARYPISTLWLIHSDERGKGLKEVPLHAPSAGRSATTFQEALSSFSSLILISPVTRTICLRFFLPLHLTISSPTSIARSPPNDPSFACYELEIPQDQVTELALCTALHDAAVQCAVSALPPPATDPSLTFLTVRYNMFTLRRCVEPTKKFDMKHAKKLERERAFRHVGEKHHPRQDQCLPGTTAASDYGTGALIVALVGKRIRLATFIHKFTEKATSAPASVIESLRHSAAGILPK
jgi:hypothetical protein